MLPREYDPEWAAEFSGIHRVLWPHFQPHGVAIHHVGSTAIPGMLAKPILDIDIEIPDYSVFDEVTQTLELLGYLPEGDLGIPDRQAFRRISPQIPHTDPARTWMEQHVYVCPSASLELHRHLYFRDTLRSNPELRTRYRKIKEDCLARCNGERKAYQSLKELAGAEFFAKVLSELRFPANLPPSL